MYYFKKDKKQQMLNMINELTNLDITKMISKSRNQVKSVQKDVIKLESIKTLCNILKIKWSFDKTTIIKEEDVLSYYKHYNNLSKELKTIFDENFQIGELKAKEDVLKAKQLVNLILKQWNGHKFNREVTKKTNKGTIRYYSYKIIDSEDIYLKIFSNGLVGM